MRVYKKIKGLVAIVDAHFGVTDPHQCNLAEIILKMEILFKK